MRKLLFFLLPFWALSGCKEDVETPLPDVVLNPSAIEVEEGQSALVSLAGGDGKNYTVSPLTTDIADASVEGNKLKVVAKTVGTKTFTVSSKDRKSTLIVKVKAKPTPKIVLSNATIEIIAGETTTVTLSGGDGSNYSVAPATSDFADASIVGNVVTIKAKAEGVQEFVVSSKDRTATLTVKVKPIPIPNLGSKLGVYGSDNNLLFEARMTAKMKKGIWLIESGVNPYSKRIFLSYVAQGVKVGDKINYPIISEGLAPNIDDTGADEKVISVIVERIEGEIAQLKSDKLRFVTKIG